jgi:hypothetical protein
MVISMRRFLIIVGLSLGLLAAAIDLAAGAVPEDVWTRYVIAKRRFQENLHGMLAEKWTDLEGTLRLQHDQQVALLKMRDLQFRWLLANHPDRIVTDAGLEGLDGFEWTAADTDSLRAHSPVFVQLEEFVADADAELDADPKVEEARRRLAAIVSEDEFRRMVRRYNAYLDQLEARLAAAD